MQITQLEKLSLIFNACMGGLGTAAGFAFPSLAFLVALFTLTGSALLFASIVGIIVFGVLALSIGIYFFYRTFSSTQNIVKEIQDKQDAMLDVLLQYAVLTKNNLEVKNNHSVLKKIYEMLGDSEYVNDINKIKTTLKTEFSSVETFTNFLIPEFKFSESHYETINSPKLHSSVNSFISYGCILGPCSGLIGAITGIGIISGISAIAPPILAAIILSTIALTILTACLTYYSESRNAERSAIITKIEDKINHFETASKQILLTSHFEKDRSPLSAQFLKIFNDESKNTNSHKASNKVVSAFNCIIV